MTSFDIIFFFTNMPVSETCTNILESLLPHSDSWHVGFNRNKFSRMLNNCTKYILFLFDGEVYTQEDGCPMGGCISLSSANISLRHFKTKWLQDYTVHFKPALYKIDVD